MFVRVAIPIPSAKIFTYAVPETLVSGIAAGKRVLVPFGRRRLTGFIIEAVAEAACDQNIKEIIALPDPEPLFDEKDLAFYEWTARYYIHPLGKVLEEVLPGGIDVKSGRWLRLTEGAEPKDLRLSPVQREILSCLALHAEGLPLSRLRKETGRMDLSGDIRQLETAGLIVSEDRLNRPAVRPKKKKWVSWQGATVPDMRLTGKQAALAELLREKGEMRIDDLRAFFKETSTFLRTLEGKGLVRIFEKELFRGHGETPELRGSEKAISLNGDQAEALSEISNCLSSRLFSPCLLHGVTGSGKTEVYLRAVSEVLEGPGSAIYLVPEIALTAQLISRIGNRFPGQEIAVLHSGIALSARYDQWKRIRRGEIRLVVGARSALFAPVRDLRLIIVDEEHDPSYKQDDRLRYNARDLSLVKGRFSKATVILGSATPAIQSYFHAAAGRYRYLTLPSRIDDRPLPKVEVVDLKMQRDEQGRAPVLSRPLIEAIGETLAGGRQTLLFLNRRGFHTFLFCPDCGHAFTCPNCDLALTHHAAEGLLKCHHCDFSARPASLCPACQGNHIRSYGTGTERVEEEVRKLFPEARIARMDSDTTSRRGELVGMLRRIERREIDILIGTQMITKGHDFPGITLVGVVAADASLNVADFRATERTFQILTQVSGRGGRGDFPGRVFVQTFNPGHYAILRAQNHDYAGFYTDELPLRQELGYPPFTRLVGLHFSSLKKEEGKAMVARVAIRARETAAALTGGNAEVIGPAESPLTRIRGRFRWQLLLRGTDSGLLHLLTQKILEGAGGGLDVQVDVDPVNFM